MGIKAPGACLARMTDAELEAEIATLSRLVRPDLVDDDGLPAPVRATGGGAACR
jgi:hypothetical protein